jgi:hypothetical protein
MKNRQFVHSSLFLILLLLAVSLVWIQPVQAQNQNNADLSRTVVIGDSLSAGYLNSSLLGTQQVHGYAYLVVTQARQPMALPLIAAPGIPNVLQLVSVGPPPVIVRAPGISTGRIDPTVQATNLAVPGHTVHDALYTRPNFPIDSLTDLVLGLPGLFGGVSMSQVEWAEAMHPTTIIVWIGSQDALNSLLTGDTSSLTSVEKFREDYTALMDRFSATGATLIVGNIPDASVIPFLVSAEEVAAQVGLPLSIVGPLLGIGSGDFVTLDAFPTIIAILTNQVPGPLPDNLVLTASEISQIHAAVVAYNQIISDEARAKGAPLVDINALFSSVRSRGIVVKGQRLTSDFLGGIVSLDGIHPTYTGHAVVANEFIHVFNARLHAGIPPLAIELVAVDDPLVLPELGRPASALGHVDPAAIAAMRATLLHH